MHKVLSALLFAVVSLLAVVDSRSLHPGVPESPHIRERRSTTGDLGDISAGGSGILNEEYLPLKSCKDILNLGLNTSGLYRINLGDDQGELTVFCDMSLLGGGWTVIQRRVDDSVDFDRDMADYLRGFGHFNGNFWLGLQKIKRITDMGTHELYIGLENFFSATTWARYSTFSLGSAASDYPLVIGIYNGSSTAGDALDYHRNAPFSTRDDDNDADQNDHCAQDSKGGWWYKSCYEANLNGIRFNSPSSSEEGMIWTRWIPTSLRTSVIAVRHT